MSMEDSARQEMVRLYFEKAWQCWTDAEQAKQLSAWSMCANRMYYALVNAFRALLLQDQHPCHKHNGIKSLVGRYYVVTGELTDQEGKLYSQMETMREKADYDCYFNAEEQDIIEKFDAVLALLHRIEGIVQSR